MFDKIKPDISGYVNLVGVIGELLCVPLVSVNIKLMGGCDSVNVAEGIQVVCAVAPLNAVDHDVVLPPDVLAHFKLTPVVHVMCMTADNVGADSEAEISECGACSEKAMFVDDKRVMVGDDVSELSYNDGNSYEQHENEWRCISNVFTVLVLFLILMLWLMGRAVCGATPRQDKIIDDSDASHVSVWQHHRLLLELNCCMLLRLVIRSVCGVSDHTVETMIIHPWIDTCSRCSTSVPLSSSMSTRSQESEAQRDSRIMNAFTGDQQHSRHSTAQSSRVFDVGGVGLTCDCQLFPRDAVMPCR